MSRAETPRPLADRLSPRSGAHISLYGHPACSDPPSALSAAIWRKSLVVLVSHLGAPAVFACVEPASVSVACDEANDISRVGRDPDCNCFADSHLVHAMRQSASPRPIDRANEPSQMRSLDRRAESCSFSPFARSARRSGSTGVSLLTKRNSLTLCLSTTVARNRVESCTFALKIEPLRR